MAGRHAPDDRQRNWYDEAFVKQFTDFPLLIRTDNLKRLRAAEVFPNYSSSLARMSPSKKVQGLTEEQHQNWAIS